MSYSKHNEVCVKQKSALIILRLQSATVILLQKLHNEFSMHTTRYLILGTTLRMQLQETNIVHCMRARRRASSVIETNALPL